MIRYFKEVWGELRRVSWPSRADVGQNTKLVIVSTIFLVIFFGLVSFGFLKLVLYLYSL